MDLAEFDYDLPKSMIAQRPPPTRDVSRLLVLSSSGIVHDTFKNLAAHLNEGDVLVLNDSKVVNAKLVGNKKTGGKVELLLLNPNGKETTCLIRGKKIREGTEIQIGDVTCEVTEKTEKGFKVRFDQEIKEIVDRYGEVPLPYYIKEPLESPERYQTVYARSIGSVAAPTAGLHFTEELLEALRKKGVKIAQLTLHIGPSTFLPIREGKVNSHAVEPEHFFIDKENAEAINQGIEDESLMVVGTSSVKALESAAANGRVAEGEAESDLFIAPGYDFKVPIKGMITNFHLPRSSLLLLVCALFGRERIFKAYSEAISRGYRFYSFGDAMLIMR
ncbi:MAG: tRNA preQ1(34) S-adenosylmethionine ribosyltransferase-isomerase QueA [Candidatus Hydrothermarchaeales archaeon]